MEKISNKTFSLERSLFGSNGLEIVECHFGSNIGESPIKECSNIVIDNCTFSMRYPVWHSNHIKIKNSNFDISTRAPFWYTKDLNIYETTINSPKALRECVDGLISNCQIVSEEFGWDIHKYTIMDTLVEGIYAFKQSTELDLNNIRFTGKYSFQYVKNTTIRDSVLDTKDAFWHAENITIINCTITGEYLGWYSKGLNLINCKIKGTQPLCYCENLTLTNCIMIDCDNAFEYSEVEATINSTIDSIKNPLKGIIKSYGIKEIIIDEFSKSVEEVTFLNIKEE